MENQEQNIQKSKTKKVVLYSIGTLALGTLTFLGIKLFTKPKTTNDDDLKETTDVDTKSTTQNYTKPVVHSALPPVHASSAFPLRLGAKGDSVLQLQRTFIATYGAGILKKYGADGYFGKELESALRSKGYTIPLSETNFKKITQEKQEKKQTPPLETFNPMAIAKAINDSIKAKDYSTSITLLKGIKNTTDYSLVSEQLKNYRINGVRQTLVNAMLTTYTESSQKLIIQEVFKKLGLKYANGKWSV
jgi:hypothetical protein